MAKFVFCLQYIFDALEGINNNRLKRKLEEEYKPGDTGQSLHNNFIYLPLVSEDLDAASLMNKLVEVTPQWYIFGEYLEIPTFKLKELRDEKGPDVCFSDMLGSWFNGGDATFEIVIEALENLHNRVLAKKVRDTFLAPIEGK